MCAALLVPGLAQGAKHPSPSGRHAVSIKVSDNPVVAGDKVAIFGRLTGPNNGNRSVTLWHRINPRPRFTPVQTVKTDANGYYAIFRQPGVVNTNRNWYVRSLGSRSRTVHEKVFSAVTLAGPTDGSNLLTGPKHKVTFTGTVAPATVGDQVVLQRQSASSGGNRWHTIHKSRVRRGGSFTIVHTFRVPGDANVRVLVRGTRRNLASPSNVLSYEISQAQNPAFTLNSSSDPITIGQSTTLSGTLQNGAGQQVTLYGRGANGGFVPVATTVADPNGGYTFTQTPIHNTLYQARSGSRASAQLFEGVKDLLTANASATSVQAGQPVTFSGTVSPDKTGHVIYLQRQNAKGNGFHTVQVASVGAGSTYSITRRLFEPGTKVFRVFIPGGPVNQGTGSQPFTITVTPATAQAVNGDQPNNDSAG